MMSGCLICLVFPVSYENIRLSLWSAGMAAVFLLAAGFLGVPMEVFLLMAQLLLLTYLAVSGEYCALNINEILRANVAWKGVEMFSKMIYCCIYMAVASIGLISWGTCMLWVCAFLSFVLYIILYLRNWFAVTLFIPSKTEKYIRSLDRRDVRSLQEDHLADGSKLSIVYERAVKAVEGKQLFLQQKYSLEDLSREVFCNKTFLSRAINAYSGKGFCYFINKFRIRYAMDLMDKDHRILVKELAFMSGFSNVVTFNMAFKAVSGKTPSEYIDNVKADLLRLSRTQGQEQLCPTGRL